MVGIYSQEQAYMQVDSHLMHARTATCGLWCIGPSVKNARNLGSLDSMIQCFLVGHMQIELSFHWLTPYLSIAVEDVVPFIDMMCRSGEWIEALDQANARLTWCTNRSQADWKRNFGELLRQHVISDAVGYKLEVIFGLEPVSLLSVLYMLSPPHRVKATVLHSVFLSMLPGVGFLALSFLAFSSIVCLCFFFHFSPVF